MMLFPWLLSACSGTPVPISLQHTGTPDTSGTSETSDTSGTPDPCLAGGTITGTTVVWGGMLVIGNEAPTEDPKPVPAVITASAPGQPDVVTDADATTGAFTLELTPGHPWGLDPVYDQFGTVDTGGPRVFFGCNLQEPVPVCSADLGAILLDCMTID